MTTASPALALPVDARLDGRGSPRGERSVTASLRQHRNRVQVAVGGLLIVAGALTIAAA